MHAVFRLEEEEFQDHHLAFEAGKESALARRGFGDGKLGRFAWYLGLRLCQCGGRAGCDDECQHHGGQRWPIHRIYSLALPRLVFALQNRMPRLRMIAYSPAGLVPTHHFIVGSTYHWFHLSTIRCISAAPDLAASSALCSPVITLATILGTSEVVKISMYAGVAYPGTPRFGVQCSASLSAVYLEAGSARASFESRTMRSGTVF